MIPGWCFFFTFPGAPEGPRLQGSRGRQLIDAFKGVGSKEAECIASHERLGWNKTWGVTIKKTVSSP